MAKLLFDLRNVPDDEADEVRALLDQHGIGFYQTKPSGWGLFAGGLWLTEDARLVEAKALLADYQRGRQARARDDYAAALREGRVAGFWTHLREEPVKVLLLVGVIVFLIALTLLPFLMFGADAR